MKKLITSKNFWLSLVFMLVSSFLVAIPNYLIPKIFPETQIAQDLIFKILPYNKNIEYLIDVITLLMMVSFGIYMVKIRINKIPQFFVTTGIGYLIKDFLSILTPLAHPNGTGLHQGFGGIFQKIVGVGNFPTLIALFPSGHAMLGTLYLFFIDRNKDKKFFLLMLILNILQDVLMLQARYHYSIDVVTGIMLAIIVGQNVRRLKVFRF